VIALCMILALTTFLIPSIVAYLYIPLFLALMLAIGIGFIYRYTGNKLPFLNVEMQDKFMNKSPPLFALIAGVLFLLGFLISIVIICIKRRKFRYIVSILRIAKICFWQNCYMIIVSIGLSGLTLAVLYFNIFLL
jgi:hypothetical protein